MDRIFLCSFGNSSYLSSLSRLRAQAEETGWFYRVECSTEKNLSAFFRQEAADLLKQEVPRVWILDLETPDFTSMLTTNGIWRYFALHRCWLSYK